MDRAALCWLFCLMAGCENGRRYLLRCCRILLRMMVLCTRWSARSVVLRALLLMAVVGGVMLAFSRMSGKVHAQNEAAVAASAEMTVAASPEGYTGSAACEHCHQQIYKSFEETRMGRSMQVADPAMLKFLPVPGVFESERLHRRFETYAKDGKLYQSEASIGQSDFRDEHVVDWIIGAGYNGYSALLQSGEFVVQAPLTYYMKTRAWELSPGYDHADLAFNRAIQADCIYCHSARPKPVDRFSGRFAAKPFEQLAIGCENCHGPGAAHVKAFSVKNADHSKMLIVNPEDLRADLDNDICMSCHESGDSRIPKPGKSYADFRPGKPLDDALSIFMVPLDRTKPKDTDHVQHYFMMTMSQCYKGSKGELRCTSCHDPHVEPTHEEAPKFFNARCLNCHAGKTGESKTCTAPIAVRKATTPADNCISCHMPRRPASESPHTTLTNHRILARADEPWPDEAFQQTTPELPNLVHLNRAPGQADAIPALTLLNAYKELAEQRREYAPLYAQQLEKVEKSDAENAEVQNQLGSRALKDGDLDNAIEHLKHAIRLDPKEVTSYVYLSKAYKLADQTADSLAVLETAAQLAPLNPALQKLWVQSLVEAGEMQRAEAALAHYLEVYPEDDEMRAVQKRLKK
jgi:hypothetical protein